MSRYNRVKGIAFEHTVRKELEGLGFFCIKSSSSRTCVDVFAVRAGQPLFIQCKFNKSGISKTEWNELFHTAVEVGAIPVFAWLDQSGKKYVTKYGIMTGPKDACRVTRTWPMEEWTPERMPHEGL